MLSVKVNKFIDNSTISRIFPFHFSFIVNKKKNSLKKGKTHKRKKFPTLKLTRKKSIFHCFKTNSR